MLRFLLVMMVLAWVASLILKLLGVLLRKRLKQTFDPPPTLDESLVRCESCQIFVPRSKALKRNDRYYCSDQHANN
jgi:hypothetical protein